MRRLNNPLLWLAVPVLLAGCDIDNDTEQAEFTLAGSVHYADREYGETATAGEYGFTATVDKPLRHAVVEVVDATDTVLASTTTDSHGGYQLQGIGAGALRVRVLARAQSPSGIEVEVRDLYGLLTAVSKSFTAEETRTLDITIDSSVAAVGAFNILDVFTAAGEFAEAISGETPEALIAYWEPGNSMGTFFCDTCAALPSIFVLGGRLDSTGSLYGDSDHFDDDVLWHEYGHFLEYNFATMDSLGGYHTLGSDDLDLRLAWSEGWSNFISGAVKEWLTENAHTALSADPSLPASFYIDTSNDVADSRQGIVWDFGIEDSHFGAQYASNELAVAKLLWDLNAGFDLAPIWQSFTSLAEADPPSNTETFWDGWNETQAPLEETQAAELFNLFLDRSIDYSEDPDEEPADDALPTARALYASEEAHTLFKPAKADEIDVVPFSVAAEGYYRIETFALTNGADTKLRILSGDGNVLLDGDGRPLENDNHDGLTYYSGSLTESQYIHDGCALASRVDLYTSAAQTLYAEVTRSADTPLSAGRYGGYKLSITQYTPNDGDTDKTKCPAPTQ